MRSAILSTSLVCVACAPQADQAVALEPSDPIAAPLDSTAEPATVAWTDVMREFEAHVCLTTIVIEGMDPFVEPIFGPRESCELAEPTTPLERAVEQAYRDARVILDAMRHAWAGPVLAAMDTPEAERLAAVRAAYLSERFRGYLLAHLAPALAAEDLRCLDCPAPFVPEARTIEWDRFAPYLGAYTWPDPVQTPRNARGKPTGEPKYSMHICIGTNGVGELPEPDGGLIELGFLASFHNEALRERAPVLYAELRTEPEFLRLRDDDSRTKWLRAELGPRIAAEPAMRVAVCETIAGFRDDTGISIAECEQWTSGP